MISWCSEANCPAGGGTFEVYHAGRYRITSAEGSNIIGTYAEPKTLRESPGAAERGTAGIGRHHRWRNRSMASRLNYPWEPTASNAAPIIKPAVAWVGPHVDKLPRLLGRDRHRLFVNWY